MKYNVYVEQCLKYDWNWKLLFDRHWKMVQYNHLQINWVKHLYRAHSSAHCTSTCAPAVSFLYWLYIFKRSSFAPVADDKLIFKFLTAPMGTGKLRYSLGQRKVYSSWKTVTFMVPPPALSLTFTQGTLMSCICGQSVCVYLKSKLIAFIKFIFPYPLRTGSLIAIGPGHRYDVDKLHTFLMDALFMTLMLMNRYQCNHSSVEPSWRVVWSELWKIQDRCK